MRKRTELGQGGMMKDETNKPYLEASLEITST